MFHLDSQAFAGLQTIHDLQIVRPRFRPVFPGMGGRVGADVALLPAPHIATFIVRAQGRRIIQPLIAKPFPKRQPLRIFPRQLRQKSLPQVVPTLMAEVPQQSPASLSELLPIDLPIGIVRLLQIDGDDPIQVSHRHLWIRDRAYDVKG